MKLKIILALLLVCGGFGLGYWVFHSPNIPNTAGDYFKAKNFKPDTIVTLVHDTSYIGKPYEVQLPPKTVVVYKDYQKPKGDTVKSLPSNWFKIDTTNKPIFAYSGYDHLIYGEISKDSIRLDLQNGNSPPFTRIYFTNYSKYKYQIINNSMRLHEYSTTKSDNITQSKKFFSYDGTYLNAGYELSGKNYSTGAQTGFNFGRVRVNGSIEIPINQPSIKPLYGVKVGYKLF